MKIKKTVYKSTCVYTGLRVRRDGKIVQRFEKPNGSEMFFTGVRRVNLGFTYKCAKTCISARPELVDVPRIDNPFWDAADTLARAQNEKKRAEKRIAAQASPALKAAIEALKPLFKSIPYYDRKALVEYLAYKTEKRKRR